MDYFYCKLKPFKCFTCKQKFQSGRTMNFIATMPKVMVFDVSFFDVNGNIIKKNFKIPKVINFEDVVLPSIDDESDEEVQTRYEVFAAIGFDRENRNSYISLVKKQLKEEKVN